jgi:hypothetical protein
MHYTPPSTPLTSKLREAVAYLAAQARDFKHQRDHALGLAMKAQDTTRELTAVNQELRKANQAALEAAQTLGEQCRTLLPAARLAMVLLGLVGMVAPPATGKTPEPECGGR